MAVGFNLHYDFRAPAFGAPAAEIYAAALEQSAWGDERGAARVVISSHHGCDDDYGPSPLVAASAIAAVTSKVGIVPVIALPLYHPLHVAEDVAVLDLVSGGRVALMVAAGYVEQEWVMFGRDPRDRGKRMEEGVTAIRQAWTGEPFEFRGEQVLVRPRPFQRPGPPIIMAGDSRPAARRAARLADAYAPMTGGDSWQHYVEACEELGKPVPQRPARSQRAMFVHVTHDPERAWSQLAPHLLHVNNSYAEWMVAAGRAATYTHADSIDELRDSDVFEVLTPEECAAKVEEWGGVTLDPLFGGIPPAIAWESLELFHDEVLPRVGAPATT